MSTLSSFFKGSERHLGVFYPRHYMIAVFQDLKAARAAEEGLFNAGFAPEDVAAVPGEQVAAEHVMNNGLIAMFMQGLSRMFQTEETYADHDVELALRGAAFLMVYCPSDQRKQQAWLLIEPARPLMARHYALAGIEHLAGET